MRLIILGLFLSSSLAAFAADVDIAKLEWDVWRKLPVKEREELGRACYEQSAELIGRDSKGKLKMVKDEGDKLILKRAGEYLDKLPPEKTPAHPAAAALYGAIPENARRVVRTVKVDPGVTRWHSTGLYAAPGEVVGLKFPHEWVGKGLKVVVSGHRDTLPFQKKPIARTPNGLARSFPVDDVVVKVAGAYGGAIYIDTGAEPREGEPFGVKIGNALQAPCFVLGKTNPRVWKNSLRKAPAPYAEFVSDRIALSFPAEWVRDLDDPTELLAYWDNVVALHDELGGLAGTRRGPERVNVDVQISVGLFHAGYPMQGPQKQCAGMADLAELKRKGNWGWFHELGHEAQRRPDKAWGWNNPYTFDGSVEVTVNLYSAHAMDRLAMADRRGWTWTADPAAVEAKAREALEGGKKYTDLGAGHKLAMYLLIRDAFGWEAIQQALSSYSSDQDQGLKKWPKDDAAKRDEFCVRMSNAVGRDLSSYMRDLWGLEISQVAASKVDDLPVWMPEGFDVAENIPTYQ